MPFWGWRDRASARKRRAAGRTIGADPPSRQERTGYSGRLIASLGHSSTHTPHSPHSSGSMTAIPLSFISMASVGHTSTQLPQPEHLSASTIAAIYYPFYEPAGDRPPPWLLYASTGLLDVEFRPFPENKPKNKTNLNCLNTGAKMGYTHAKSHLTPWTDSRYYRFPGAGLAGQRTRPATSSIHQYYLLIPEKDRTKETQMCLNSDFH